MIKINISNSSCKIEGHADYAEHGKDIVCSAVSALSQSVFLALNELTIVTLINNNNSFKFDIREPSEVTDAVMSVLKIGFKEIESKYKENIELKIEEEI